jgi:ribosomal subunit interface protein
MQVDINGKELKITKRKRSIIEEKLVKPLDQYVKNYPNDLKRAAVRVEKGARWGFKVSFSLWLPGKRHIFSEAKDKGFTKAVTEVREQTERRIKQYRGKN